MDGILLIDKEAGFTSHDVVAILRGVLHQKKIGHAGTLDPGATGLLPVCLGKATKCVNLASDADKCYRTVMRLGTVTDTQDMSGTVLQERPAAVSEEEVRAAVQSFAGGYDQIPPMYSAKKVGGRKLYDLARKGQTVEREPVHVRINGIRIEDISLPEVTMTVSCGKGTYIRTLCHDIGERLGCGAAMKELRRTAVAGFSIEQAAALAEVRRAAEEGTVEELLIPVKDLFAGYKRFTVSPAHEKALLNGNVLFLNWGEASDRFGDGEAAAVFDHQGELQAVYTFSEREGRLKPFKMLLSR